MRSWNLFIGSLGKKPGTETMDHGFSTENGAIFEFHTMDVVNSEGALESFWNFGLSRTVAPLHGCDLFHLRMVMVIASLALSAPMVP